MNMLLTPQKIEQEISRLPAFPTVVNELLRDLEDENSSMMVLAQHVECDQVMTGRILAAANRFLRAEGWSEARNVYTAVSMIGFSRIRDIVLTSTIAGLNGNFASQHFHWRHCLAAGIASQELLAKVKGNQSEALVAGLLHDIGQLWLAYFCPLEFQQVRLQVEVHDTGIRDAERAMFGMDHCDVGRIIAEYWRLPKDIIAAIANHHEPDDKVALSPIAASVHLAEAIIQALDLPYRDQNCVFRISGTACRTLGIQWDEESFGLLGAIDARYQHALSVFP
ncbi:MAG: HDOD domain-containing protein [Zoogloeaceae bacterium]|jgi:putative nucleotidyltransferase with HDIG domain|nr:HDOD domain-containing protein [Zoogloeaceae bacterium]